jgi:hypothetical protein
VDNGSVIGRFDCGHGGMKMDPDALLAAVRRQEVDERAVASDDSRLRAPAAVCPFVAHANMLALAGSAAS